MIAKNIHETVTKSDKPPLFCGILVAGINRRRN